MCNHSPNREAAMVVIDPGTPERKHRDGIWCDPCLVPLVTALNDAGMPTVASCCGHGEQVSSVALADGRWVLVMDDATYRAMDTTIRAEREDGEGEPLTETEIAALRIGVDRDECCDCHVDNDTSHTIAAVERILTDRLATIRADAEQAAARALVEVWGIQRPPNVHVERDYPVREWAEKQLPFHPESSILVRRYVTEWEPTS